MMGTAAKMLHWGIGLSIYPGAPFFAIAQSRYIQPPVTEERFSMKNAQWSAKSDHWHDASGGGARSFPERVGENANCSGTKTPGLASARIEYWNAAGRLSERGGCVRGHDLFHRHTRNQGDEIQSTLNATEKMNVRRSAMKYWPHSNSNRSLTRWSFIFSIRRPINNAAPFICRRRFPSPGTRTVGVKRREGPQAPPLSVPPSL